MKIPHASEHATPYEIISCPTCATQMHVQLERVFDIADFNCIAEELHLVDDIMTLIVAVLEDLQKN